MILLLFSGGLDSMLLAERAARSDTQLVTLFYRYPHPAAPEEYRAVAEWHRLKRLAGKQIRHIEISLPLWGTEQMDIGTGQPGPRILPARNQVMISIAINIAASIGADCVMYGANADDNQEYVDCRPGWVQTMDELARPWGISISAPLLNQTKQEIKAEAVQLGVSGWWSCYQPRDGHPCGTCDSCRAVIQ